MTVSEGKVIETRENLATIRVGKHDNCTACGACASAKNVVVTASNPAGAKTGDRVKFTLPEENILWGAFMVFVFPLLFAALGAVFSFYFFYEYIVETTVIFFLISLLFVKMYDTKKGKEMESKAKIIEIVG